jgi:hypothetical protein
MKGLSDISMHIKFLIGIGEIIVKWEKGINEHGNRFYRLNECVVEPRQLYIVRHGPKQIGIYAALDLAKDAAEKYIGRMGLEAEGNDGKA